MFKRNPSRLAGAALCTSLFLGGCANHLSQRSEHEERVERKLLDHSFQVDLGEPKTLELPQRRIRIHELKTFDITEFEVTRHSMKSRWALWPSSRASARTWSTC